MPSRCVGGSPGVPPTFIEHALNHSSFAVTFATIARTPSSGHPDSIVAAGRSLQTFCMADGSEPEVGQVWAYRARQTDDVAQVEVLKFGTQRPARVLVRFVDDYEGRQEWVPPARLKVLWESVDTSRKREAEWGLDIFQKGSGSQFDIGARRQEFKQVVAFGVTYIREAPAQTHQPG